MNVLFISPHFPSHFHHFCQELKNLGVQVLGVGDAPYDTLAPECRNALTEYYYTPSLENYDSVYRAAAFFIGKYGRLDFVESQNEYWLTTEARLRADFNIHTGFSSEELTGLTAKSGMKAGYARAGVTTARYLLVNDSSEKTSQALVQFVQRCGYPLIAKPDSGVGAADTWKINGPDDLSAFLAKKPSNRPYLVEEFVPGHIETYDGIVDAEGEVVFAASQRMRVTPLAMLQGSGENISVTQPLAGTDLEQAGKAVVAAFGLRRHFFHCEFFRLDEDKAGLGRVGDLLGLEINLRAPGGYIPDKMDFAYNVDVYRIWAETLVLGTSKSFRNASFTWYVTHFARGAGLGYLHSVDEIRTHFGGTDRWIYDRDPPRKLAGGMGAYAVLLRAKSREEIKAEAAWVLAHA